MPSAKVHQSTGMGTGQIGWGPIWFWEVNRQIQGKQGIGGNAGRGGRALHRL